MDTHTPPPPSPSPSEHVIVYIDDDNTTPPSSIKRPRRFTLFNPKSRFLEYSAPIIADELEPLTADQHTKVDKYAKYDHEGFRNKQSQKKKKKKMLLAEWFFFIALSTAFVCSLTLNNSDAHRLWGLKLWRWSLMLLSIISGRLVSGWLIKLVVFILERSCTLRGKVLYFVYGLRRRIRYCVWLGFVLLTWTLVLNSKLHQRNKVLHKVFQVLVATLIGLTIWLLKIVAVKALASSFHIKTYFDRMKESAFHHYVLEILSSPSTEDIASEEPHRRKKKIDIPELKKLWMQSKASAWTIKKLATYVKSFGLTTVKAVEDSEIASEWEARIYAKRIFKNVAKSDAKYIEEEDLMRFLKRSEIHTMLPVFEGALETGKITKSAFRNWVVRAYYERKSLAHSLSDTKRAVRELHKLASAVASMIIMFESLSVMEVASSKVIVLLLTQFLVLGFAFQNTCKTVFESIVFVFVMHPFDIGDRCVIDGVQMIVEEMDMLTTVFLRLDNEKVYYPNSVLITKPISNLYRSPEMRDVVDFNIDSSTSKDTIIALEKSIQAYILSKPKHWNPKHAVIAKGIENVHVLKMALCVQHTINNQFYGDRCTRITDLILELKTMFEDLNIKYHSQEVHVTGII